MDEYFDSERPIIEVEKRPAIYDRHLHEYSDKTLKEKLWTEVCEAIVPNWSQLDKEGISAKGKDVQRKWKNIRDAFRKELNQQKTVKSGSGNKKRRKYIYFEPLSFLIPTLQECETSGNYTAPLNSSDAAEGQEGLNNNYQSVQVTNTEKSPSPNNNEPHRHKRRMSTKPSYEESLLHILKESKREEVDEDKSFLLSLLPTFKTLSSQQKFTAKVDFLQVLQIIPLPSNIPGHPSHARYENTFMNAHSHFPYPSKAFGSAIMPPYNQLQQLIQPEQMVRSEEIFTAQTSSTRNHSAAYVPSPEPSSCSTSNDIALSYNESTLLSTESELLELH